MQHVRWEPAAGRLQHFFDDDLVCASAGIHPGLLRGIEPFPAGDLKPYDAGYIAGWIVERYQIDLIAAAQRARESMDAKIQALAAQQVPGDTFRNLTVWTAIVIFLAIVIVALVLWRWSRRPSTPSLVQ